MWYRVWIVFQVQLEKFQARKYHDLIIFLKLILVSLHSHIWVDIVPVTIGCGTLVIGHCSLASGYIFTDLWKKISNCFLEVPLSMEEAGAEGPFFLVLG